MFLRRKTCEDQRWQRVLESEEGGLGEELCMTTITIALSEERLAQLRTWAEQTGLSPEEFLRRRVEQLLDQPDQPFRQAADHVLRKNAELYRRLA
jgi:antitoxin FitA